MKKDSEKAGQSIGTLIKRAEQAMLRAKTAVLKPMGLGLAQYVALAQLERQEGITAAGLARACFVSPQAIMILLKTSEQQGLVSRTAHPLHSNVLEIRLTEVGRAALHAARELLEPLEEQVLREYSPEELSAFRDYLSRFAAGFSS